MRRMLSSFLDLVRLQSQMNQLFEALNAIQHDEDQGEAAFSAPYDIVEGKDHITVLVDLPGVDPASLRILGGAGTIVIQGERPRIQNAGLVAYHLLERDRGPFKKTLHLEGAFDTHKAAARYERGVLSIRLPRVAERRGRLVPIPLSP